MKQGITLLLILSMINSHSQQTIQVTDSMPAILEGLKAGYDITGTSEKEVGNKGDFGRFKIHFYITNTSSQAKVILHKPNSNIFGSGTSPDIAQFKCLNATGARMTSKEFTLQAKPCIIDALVEETDPAGKAVQNKKLANIGYWIRPGETIASNTIVIVPLNEKPHVSVTFFPGPSNMPGTVINNNNGYDNNNYNNNNYSNTNYNNNPNNNYNNNPNTNYNNNNNNSGGNNNFNTAQNIPQGFIHIKNFASNNYLHNQNGPAACTAIDHEWWSAQWEVLPVNGTNYYQIKNRWRNNFISTDNNSMISDNGKSANAMWMIEETANNSKIYTLRNAANNSKLTYQDGQLKAVTSSGNQVNMQWIMEQ